MVSGTMTQKKKTGYRHAYERGAVVFLCFVEFVRYVEAKVMIVMRLGLSTSRCSPLKCPIRYRTTIALGSTWC